MAVKRTAWPYLTIPGAAAILAGPAHAEDMKLAANFGWVGTGKAFALEQGHIYWVGEFTGTFFNDKGRGSPGVGAHYCRQTPPEVPTGGRCARKI